MFSYLNRKAELDSVNCCKRLCQFQRKNVCFSEHIRAFGVQGNLFEASRHIVTASQMVRVGCLGNFAILDVSVKTITLPAFRSQTKVYLRVTRRERS